MRALAEKSLVCSRVEFSSMTDVFFETNRLRMRAVTEFDFDQMLALYSDPQVIKYVDDGQPISVEDCHLWIERTLNNYQTQGYGMTVIESRDGESFIGFVGVTHPGNQVEAEIKYSLFPQHWGKGYATEVVQGMLVYVAEKFGLERVIATTYPENTQSHRVLEKSGMSCFQTVIDEDGDTSKDFEWLAESSSAH
jgi:RimJ/RimL family protein N-acetyltransferase